MATIYLVTAGSYSDYRIVAAFSTDELAKEFVAAYNGSDRYKDADVEEFEIDSLTRRLRGEEFVVSVTMDREGRTLNVETSTSLTEYMADWCGYNYSYPGKIVLRVMRAAKDVQTVVKIANEKRVQLIAEGEWNE